MASSSAPRYGTVNREYGMQLATTAPEHDGPVWMVNLMKYREVANYTDGRETSISGREADDLYAPLGPLAAIGAEVVFAADVERQLVGSPTWDRIGIVKYPTRKSFIEMQSRSDFRELHEHKDAGMEMTIVMGNDLNSKDWSEVAHPPTEEDGAIVVMHVLKFDGEAAGEMEGYHQVAGAVAGPHGAKIHAFFGVEGTILGDGRSWDEVRMVGYPSRRAFMAVVADPKRLEAQEKHRQRAIADTYTMMLKPRINRLEESIA
jgi:hypothetical protein